MNIPCAFESTCSTRRMVQINGVDEPCPSREELRKLTEETVSFPYISGPVYENLNKKLADYYMEEQQEQLAIFHLTESHGCTLRHQARYRYEVAGRWLRDDSGDTLKHDMMSMKNIVALDGSFRESKAEGLQNRLKCFPSDWTIIQITMRFNPLSRFTSNLPDGSSSIYITRLSCGNMSNSLSLGKGGPPISVCVSPRPGYSDPFTIAKSVKELVEDRTAFTGSAKSSVACGVKVKALVKDFRDLLADCNCLLPGYLTDAALQQSIAAKVDKIIDSFSADLGHVSTKLRQILHLSASCPVWFGDARYSAITSMITDKTVANKVFEALKKIHSEYETALQSASRSPVIVIMEEKLDIFPIEMLSVLEGQPVSRVPSIHFAHALYWEHRETLFRTGVNVDDGYFIVNPSGDLKRCETAVRKFLPTLCPKWTGLYGTPPDAQQYTKALEDHSVLLYCGHGGGNQYAPDTGIEKIRTKAITFLFGCSSSRMNQPGGRASGYSIFNSYTIAGCPCSVGMLWNVSDADVNNMTEILLSAWLGEQDKSVEDITANLKNINIGDECYSKPRAARCQLLQALPLAKKQCKYYLNAAAVVARGLPV